MDVIKVIQIRDKVVSRVCEEKGWDKENLTFEQILEIRKDPEWQNATKA